MSASVMDIPPEQPLARRRRQDRIGHAVGVLLLLATVVNGAGPYLKRLGVLERGAYDRYWRERCGPQGVKPVWWGFGRGCVATGTAAAVFGQPSWAPAPAGVDQGDWPLKVVKDAVLAGLLAVGAVAWWRHRTPISRAIWLPSAFAGA